MWAVLALDPKSYAVHCSGAPSLLVLGETYCIWKRSECLLHLWHHGVPVRQKGLNLGCGFSSWHLAASAFPVVERMDLFIPHSAKVVSPNLRPHAGIVTAHRKYDCVHVSDPCGRMAVR